MIFWCEWNPFNNTHTHAKIYKNQTTENENCARNESKWAGERVYFCQIYVMSELQAQR